MPVRSLIFDHFWLKLFSAVLATLIWLDVHSNLGDETTSSRKVTRQFLNRPVLLLTEASATRTFRVEPAEVNVLVQGPVHLLNVLKEPDIQVFVRLPNGRTSGTAPVRVHVPAGVTVSHIDPLTVTIKPADSP